MLSVIMVGRCAGLLILPTTVTSVFKTMGPMSLMHAVFVCVLMMLTSLVISQFLTHKYGVNDRLHGRTDHPETEEN